MKQEEINTKENFTGETKLQSLYSVQLNNYDNSWYNPGSFLKRITWIFISAVFFNNSLALFTSFKCFLLRLFGAKVGKEIMIKTSVNIKYPWHLTIGDYAWIGENVWIDNLAQVDIGNNACISQGAMLLTGNHNFNKSTFDLIVKPIIIEDGVWIGAKAVVCPGVTAYSHALLTVQSVATKNLEAYTIYQGNPAVAIKKRIVQV